MEKIARKLSISGFIENFKGEFEYFEIKTGEWQEELLERFDTEGTLLYRSVELGERSVELGEKNVKLTERAVELGEKSVALSEESVRTGERMLEKQEDTIAEIRNVSEKIDHGKEDIVTEIRLLREDLR